VDAAGGEEVGSGFLGNNGVAASRTGTIEPEPKTLDTGRQARGVKIMEMK